ATAIHNAVTAQFPNAPETARRVHARIRRVLDYAAKKTLPPRGRINHHEALPYADVPQFMAELRAGTSHAAQALEFTVLTAARAGETYGAEWGEFDLANAIWIVPASRMKSHREHRVPLCDRAVEILKSLPRKGPGPFPMARTAMRQLVKRLR